MGSMLLLILLILLQAFPLATCGLQGLPTSRYTLVVLGVAQDGGYPQAGCTKACCTDVWEGKGSRRSVASLAIIEKSTGKLWMIEATPDFREQLKFALTMTGVREKTTPDGIILTHAHIGHYTGLMHLGREVMGTRELPVFVMPRMKEFLSNNAPWNQLLSLQNITAAQLRHQQPCALTEELTITPFLVPHRDELSETIGLMIQSRNKKILFIPDIDKWERWNNDIRQEVLKADLAFLDATFYDGGELSNRRMEEVPHPFVVESIKLFQSLPAKIKAKIYFLHFNHTNPLLRDTPQRDTVRRAKFNIAEEHMTFDF